MKLYMKATPQEKAQCVPWFMKRFCDRATFHVSGKLENLG